MAGRPKRVFTDEEIQLMEQYARNNCYDNTIAVALDIPMNSLKRHYGKKIQRWRAQGKVDLRHTQRLLAQTSSDMAKFLGKNELKQVDRQEIKQETTEIQTLTEKERIEAQRLANIRLREGA